MLDLSKVWPEWTAEEKLGEGAYGSVYKCVRRERGITSYCAIKVITVPHDSSELDSLKLEGYTDETSKEYFNDIVDNFVNEISVMENLKGLPNIVSVEDFKIVEHADNVGWDIYIRMELLTSFKRYLENHAMTQNEVLKFGTDICAALEICEENRIIHRDIKEDNIFVDKRGNFKLGDFGIAKQLERTRSATSHVGAYAYMAPEVPINGRCDKRADIYSLGIVMYKLLNKNRDPFLDTEKQMIRYQERVDAVNRRLDGEDLPKPVNADDAVAEIILKACKFNKEERFASATEMKSAIEGLLAPKKEPEIPEEKVQTTIQEEITEEVKHEGKTEHIKISENHPENVAYTDGETAKNSFKKKNTNNLLLWEIINIVSFCAVPITAITTVIVESSINTIVKIMILAALIAILHIVSGVVIWKKSRFLYNIPDQKRKLIKVLMFISDIGLLYIPIFYLLCSLL